MSEESRLSDEKASRSLRLDEKKLLAGFFSNNPRLRHLNAEIEAAKVRDMPDGGMGGIVFLSEKEYSLGEVVLEGEYFDSDGVLVEIVLNANEVGGLYELDFWKTDFSPLKKYPIPSLVNIKNI